MKKYLFALIVISLSLEMATYSHSDFITPYFHILLPKKFLPWLKLIIFIATILALYWEKQEIKKNKTLNYIRLEFYKRMREYVEKKKVEICFNLVSKYGNLINPEVSARQYTS